MKHNIKHLAFIMDGNARWAKKNNLSATLGHKQGAEAAKNILKASCKYEIPYLTLYAFSSENWQRPQKEVSFLMELLKEYLVNQIEELNKNGIKLLVIGDLSKLGISLQHQINDLVKNTQHNDKMTLCIAFSYGSRAEIINACSNLIKSGIQNITEDIFKKYLYDPNMPDVDLVIRTSGEHRISNFLLWQLAYAELYFTDKLWPEFEETDLLDALNDFCLRKRNFGKR